MASQVIWDLVKETGKAALRDALKKKGFSAPQVSYQEDEDTMTLIISGTDINGSGTVDGDFQGRFWTGNFRATAEGSALSHDKITVNLTARHRVLEGRPHPGDAPEGELAKVSSLSITSEGNAGSRIKASRKIARHPAAHNDIYVATLVGEAVDETLWNNFTSWSLEIKAVHTGLDLRFLVDPRSGSGDRQFAYNPTPNLGDAKLNSVAPKVRLAQRQGIVGEPIATATLTPKPIKDPRYIGQKGVPLANGLVKEIPKQISRTPPKST